MTVTQKAMIIVSRAEFAWRPQEASREPAEFFFHLAGSVRRSGSIVEKMPGEDLKVIKNAHAPFFFKRFHAEPLRAGAPALIGSIHYSICEGVASSESYHPNQHLFVPGSAYFLELLTLPEIAKIGATHIYTDEEFTSKSRARQLKIVQLPLSERVPIEKWAQGMLLGLSMAIAGYFADSREFADAYQHALKTEIGAMKRLARGALAP